MAWWLFFTHPATGTTLACGSTLDRDIILDADVICPDDFTGTALTMVTSGITLDGAGHRIQIASGIALKIENIDHAAVKNLDLSAPGSMMGEGIGIYARDLRSLSLDDLDVSSRDRGIAAAGVGEISLTNIVARTSRVAVALDAREVRLRQLSTEGSAGALWLSGVERLETDALSFRDNRWGVQIERSRGVVIDGWSLDGIDETAITLNSCDNCSVIHSTLSGSGEGIAVFGSHERFSAYDNDLSYIYAGWALSIGSPDGDLVENNRFDSSQHGLYLRDARAIYLADNTFADGQRAITVEDSEDFTLDGLMLDGFSGVALTLVGCHRCTVEGSSLAGAGTAIDIQRSSGVLLSANNVSFSQTGVSVSDSLDIVLDEGNIVDGINGAIIDASASAITLDGLVASCGSFLAVDSVLTATRHQSCGARFVLHESTAALGGAVGEIVQHDSRVSRGPDTVADSDSDGSPDACDTCNDPDRDGRCSGEDPCTGLTDTDKDGDGWCTDTDCDDTLAAIHPGADEISCNRIDEDCSAETPDEADTDHDGFTVCTDCDDRDNSRFPGARERCDGRDDDCNSQPDDGLPFDAWFADADHDGYGSNLPTFTCDGAPAGHVSNHVDCDDTRNAVHPGSPEVLHNQLDDDCNRFTSDTEPGTLPLD